jgi:hypothetical protein
LATRLDLHAGIILEVTNPGGQATSRVSISSSVLSVEAGKFVEVVLYSEAALLYLEAALLYLASAILKATAVLLSAEDLLPMRNIRAWCQVQKNF